MSRGRNSPIRRPRNPQPLRRVIRVHAEGDVTEPRYLEELGRRHRDRVRIDIGETGAVPETLVDRACRDMDKSRIRRREGPLYDEIWCVFDVDEHPNLKGAINRALQKKVKLAVSNPCFELWLILHFQDQTAYISGHDAQRLAKRREIMEGKEVRPEMFGQLENCYESAKQRAKTLDKKHDGDGSPPRSNPSTGMWRLIDSIRQLPARAKRVGEHRRTA
ncbi:MAG: RloB domain-containing protein [Acidimicrobiia bacterium]|nr:RloB domain-containing protein [Acidimicrobiia bacterium]